MTINQRILQALKSVGVPVSFQQYSGQTSSYITFFTYLEAGEQYADDREAVTRFSVQLDVWSKQDYTELVKAVDQAMHVAGFVKNGYFDLYETDSQMYHKAMRFHFEEEVL